MFIILLLALLVGIDAHVDSTKWAVLVAGSSNFYNYRHQSDVAHMYHILKKGGLSDDHIITMLYDDIAYNLENPYPGNIINYPDGPNVYRNMLKDYTGDDVTPENFLNVLKGNSSGVNNRKVLKSGPIDNVFIYMTDHGGPGVFCFPHHLLHADDFIETLKYMSANKMFKNLVIYLEACESGSMLDNLLPDNLGIYVMTASSPQEPSYACYLDRQRGIYLNDCFSINFLLDDDNFTKGETLFQQYSRVLNETINSNVCRYGQLSLDHLLVSDFIGKSHKKTQVENREPSDAILSSRTKLKYLLFKLEKEIVKRIEELDLDRIDDAYSDFSKELELLVDAHLLYSKYKTEPRGNPSDCHVPPTIDLKCTKRIIEEQFGGYPNEYQLEILKHICVE